MSSSKVKLCGNIHKKNLNIYDEDYEDEEHVGEL